MDNSFKCSICGSENLAYHVYAIGVVMTIGEIRKMKHEVTKEEYELLEVIKNSNVEEFANNHTWYIRYKLRQALILRIINDKENRQMFVDKLVHVLQQECREYDEIISSVGKKDKVDLKFQL